MKKTLLVYLFFLMLFLFSACDSAAVSYPANRIYLLGATDTPRPTDRPPAGFYYCFDPPCTILPDGRKPKDPPTPYPSPTPYIQKYVFYRTQMVNINGLVVEFLGVIRYYYEVYDEHYHVLYFRIWNRTGVPAVVPFPLTGKIREIRYGGSELIAEWDAGEHGQDFLRFWMTDKIQAKWWKDYTSEEHMVIPPTIGNNPIVMPVVIRAIPGFVHRYILITDPMSKDPENFIMFYNSLPPMRCDNERAATPAGMGEPACLYHAEINPLHYFRSQEPAPVSYYFPSVSQQTENGVVNWFQNPLSGSSQNFYSVMPFEQNAPMSAEFVERVVYQGPTSNIMPLDKISITQNFGCTGYSYARNITMSDGTKYRAGDCAYRIFLTQCEWPNTRQCRKPGSQNEYGWGFHMGIDFGGSVGDYVYAVSNSTVLSASEGWNGGYGTLIVLADNDYCYYYAHLSKIHADVVQGANIKAGMAIGQLGNTGASSGPHLHFEMRPRSGGGCASGGTKESYINAQGFLGLLP